MKFLELLTQANQQQFINAQLTKTGDLSPRKGYMFVKSLFYQTLGDAEFLCAKCEWLPLTGKRFIANHTYDIALRSLYHGESYGPKGLSEQSLIGKIIVVKDVNLVLGISKCRIVQVEWSVLDKEAKYYDPNTALIEHYLLNKKSLIDLQQEYINSIGSDLANELIKIEGDQSAAATDFEVSDDITEADDWNPDDDDSDKDDVNETSK